MRQESETEPLKVLLMLEQKWMTFSMNISRVVSGRALERELEPEFQMGLPKRNLLFEGR